MTQPRLPAVGDSVRLIRNEKVTFEGYVVEVDGAYCTLAASGEIPFTASPHEETPWSHPHRSRTQSVLAVVLVRGLHGWRWAPFDGRPQVGDLIRHRYTVEDYGEILVETLITQCPAYDHMNLHSPWIGISLADERRGSCVIAARDAAKAIAGIDGWSWEPARWSGPKEER